MFLADIIAADPISGGAGWFGAGLLGLVLGWLMLKHLPDKDKQVENLIKTKDLAINEIVKAFQSEIKIEREVFQTEMKAERLSCDKHFDSVSRSIEALAQRYK